MSLKLGTFPVERLQTGPTTGWSDGVLTVDVVGLTALAAETPNVERASIEITSPGESSRIIHVNDVLEPRVKVEGPGQVFPESAADLLIRLVQALLIGSVVSQWSSPLWVNAPRASKHPLRKVR